ncbi:Uncharacterised protein [Cedecea davisae]|uniref:hypothetical protein n=1 Tax=Cedecea davisae TaxID=158484 RepID=UPI0003AAE78D|nr:Uncharacterised protein [Cedecea davisae]
MKHLLLALFMLVPLKLSFASVTASIQVSMTIMSDRLPPKITRIKLSEDRVMIINEW